MEIVEKLGSGSAAATDLEWLERLVAMPLPADYREFLIRTNGGRPEPSAFSFEEYGKAQESVVDWFFTLDVSEKEYLITSEVEAYCDRIPQKTLPIACDPFGNLILLDLGTKSVGAIYFWDHENENMEGDPWWDNISFIAPSFTEFIENLH